MATKTKTDAATSTGSAQDTFAVIKTGGKQYVVTEGDKLKVETLDAEVGDEIELETVLLTSKDGDVSVGTPELDAKVTAEVLEHGRGKKLHILKFKRKKGYMRRMGHRQDYTEIEIKNIS